MKKLPVGIQSFEKIREQPDQFYYVDKTPFVKKLLEQGGGYFFLSRPRRFGKSLFVDTLRQAFLAKKEYFQGLYLENNWDWNTAYPVIHVSFGSGVMGSLEELELTQMEILGRNCRLYGIEHLDSPTIRGKFFELIKRLHEKHGQKVVVLIDEYDKPFLDNIANTSLAVEMSVKLISLYSVLKDADVHLKFVFITGVSKFSRASLFSGLNHLNDITLDARFSTLCGYTQKELETVFADQLEGLDKGRIRQWYNGYSWLGEKVYNPFDILLYFSERQFRSFWFETGTPRFLIELLMGNHYPIARLENLVIGEEIIDSFDVDRILVEALLFQTGYLTIERMDENMVGRRTYQLAYPNMEVKSSLNRWILNELVEDVEAKSANETRLIRAIQTKSFNDLRDIFHSFFASIPHDWYRKNELSGYEGYYASIFYCYFAACGFEIRAEDATNHGRMDLSLFYEDICCIFEFKVLENAGEGSAMAQLKDRKYHEKYQGSRKEIYLVAVEFSKKDRNIENFEVEKVS
ncbi:PD-(D/E)XK nuclease superfamily protein [Desulfobotulus alkaliphilus]|uniref:PD-(D/E)XK nuclease superfamily protein n=1 Tax=Desulfobotulus alkaliphilus TaxID=622671 RepID=A0A562S830_9BACT|nr:ATP-binding protein [Desulfobotulus alkaliphilus]TWI77343.1 PD-(D/E)XK nuclease superfamily protein [Desulfobotulus alkaliphilus]